VVPLFSGYLFVTMDLKQEPWSAINGTFGVRRLLCRSDRPASVPALFIDSLRRTVDEGGVVAVPEPGLRPGQKVRLMMRMVAPVTCARGLTASSSGPWRLFIVMSTTRGVWAIECNNRR